MEDNNEDRLESIEINPSKLSEETILKLGELLHDSLVKAERLDEVELLLDIIVEYSVMTSFYGEKTDRIPESIAVDLNEAALLKRDGLSSNRDTEWQIYAQQFKDALLGLDIGLSS